jgi:hypothetical protein
MKRTTLLVRVGASVLALLGGVVGKGGGMIVMANRVRVVVVMAALALAAGLLALALGAKPAQAQAETDTVNDWITIEDEEFNPCTDEMFFIEGTSHFVFHITEDASGGFHIRGHVNAQHQGVSESGAKYVAPHTSNNHQKIDVFSESASNFTHTSTLQFIRQGSETSEDDFEITERSHVTVNANGEVTSEVEQVEFECK